MPYTQKTNVGNLAALIVYPGAFIPVQVTAGTSGNTTSPGAGQILLTPFYPMRQFTTDSLHVRTANAVIGQNIVALIYSADLSNIPNQLLLQSDPVSVPTADEHSVQFAFTFLPQTYWIGIWVELAGSTIRTGNTGYNLNVSPVIDGILPGLMQRSVLPWNDPAPDPWGFTTADIAGLAIGGNVPFFLLRVAM